MLSIQGPLMIAASLPWLTQALPANSFVADNPWVSHGNILPRESLIPLGTNTTTTVHVTIVVTASASTNTTGGTILPIIVPTQPGPVVATSIRTTSGFTPVYTPDMVPTAPGPIVSATTITSSTDYGTPIIVPTEPGPQVVTSIHTTSGFSPVYNPGTIVLTPPGPVIPGTDTTSSSINNGTSIIILTEPGPVVVTSIRTTSGFTPVYNPSTIVLTPPGPVISGTYTTTSNIDSGTPILIPTQPGPIVPTKIDTTHGFKFTPGTTVPTPPGPVIPGTSTITSSTDGGTPIIIPTEPGPIITTIVGSTTSSSNTSSSTTTSNRITSPIPTTIPLPGTIVPTPPGPVFPTSNSTGTSTKTSTSTSTSFNPSTPISWSNGGPGSSLPTAPGRATPVTTIVTVTEPSSTATVVPTTVPVPGFEPVLPDLLHKPELSADYVCAKWSARWYGYWVIQFPPSWWQGRYKNSTNDACYAIQYAIREIWSELTECSRMDGQHASGGPGWLQARFVTSGTSPDESFVTGMMSAMRDRELWRKQPLPLKCQHHVIGDAKGVTAEVPKIRKRAEMLEARRVAAIDGGGSSVNATTAFDDPELGGGYW